jgi:hypothetical protein
MATGSGKTGYSIMLILVKHAMSENEPLALTFSYDPVMVGCLSYTSSSGRYGELI